MATPLNRSPSKRKPLLVNSLLSATNETMATDEEVMEGCSDDSVVYENSSSKKKPTRRVLIRKDKVNRKSE